MFNFKIGDVVRINDSSCDVDAEWGKIVSEKNGLFTVHNQIGEVMGEFESGQLELI